MTLQGLINEVIELLENPEFKNFGSLQKHKYQMSKPEEYREIARIMYKGQIGNSEAIKKGHATRKKRNIEKEVNKKAAQKRSAWYKNNPENYAKFMEAIRKRDYKRYSKKK